MITLRQIKQGTNPIDEGGAVDVLTVIPMGHGLSVDFTPKTVVDAFHTFATERLEFQDRSVL